jgi:hypothetical protein
VFAAHVMLGSLGLKRGGFLFASPSGWILKQFSLLEPENTGANLRAAMEEKKAARIMLHCDIQ